jgi:hypothetical protein
MSKRHLIILLIVIVLLILNKNNGVYIKWLIITEVLCINI